MTGILDQQTVTSERRGMVEIVTLNRPDALNALTLEMAAAYRGALRAADAAPEVRAVVVTGAGRAFCAGADIAVLEALAADPARDHFGVEFAEPLLLDTPLVAAVNGGCVGLGLSLALQCDVRFVANEAKISTAFAQRGVVAEQGMCALLRHLAGEGAARDLLLSSRVIRGDEAVRLGLANRAVARDEVLDVAVAYATEMAQTCAPESVATIKRQLREGMLAEFRREAAEAVDLLREAVAGPDFAEGLRSYRERRAPRFGDRPYGSR